MGRDHAQDEAEELVRIGLKKYKLKEEALERLPGSDERKENVNKNAWLLLDQLFISKGNAHDNKERDKTNPSRSPE
jgi:hypothetical protein